MAKDWMQTIAAEQRRKDAAARSKFNSIVTANEQAAKSDAASANRDIMRKAQGFALQRQQLDNKYINPSQSGGAPVPNRDRPKLK